MQNQITLDSEAAENIALASREMVSHKTEAMKQWEQAWAAYFRLDETRSEAELQSLCKRLRALATSVA